MKKRNEPENVNKPAQKICRCIKTKLYQTCFKLGTIEPNEQKLPGNDGGYFVGNSTVVFEGQILVIYKVNNGSDKAKSTRKKVQNSKSDLFGDKPMNARNPNKTKQGS